MHLTRRDAMVAGGLGVALSACGVRPVDRAGRDVLAAGQPAALLIWAVARGRLLGWPRKPGPAALRVLPPEAAILPQLGALTNGGAPAGLEAVAALHPRLIIDYGDIEPRYQALAERMKARLGVDWRLIDGALVRIPAAIRQAAGLLDAGPDAEALAVLAERVLADWRGRTGGPRFYYARGADGLETAFHGALATEVLEGAGWTNVATGARDLGRVSREQVAAWDPETLVTIDPAVARTMDDDPVWRRRADGSRRRLLLIPDTPFGWVDHPPSVNRLLGCAWLAAPNDGARIADLARALYGEAAPAMARPRWIP